MSGAAATGIEPLAVPTLRWRDIVRLGLVQAALGAVVVLVTSTLNRVMVVEYALPATLPGVLVALHYAVQMIRPRFGFGSDRGARRTPWVIGGMLVLAAGGVLCAAATPLLKSALLPGLALALCGYTCVGLGVGAAGTSLLVLMADRVDDRRRAAAATIMWVLMILGFAVTSATAGHFLDPFSPERLLKVTAAVALGAVLLSIAALWNVETDAPRRTGPRQAGPRPAAAVSFRESLRKVWQEPQARAFTLFVFVSMLAYSAQELLLEPFSGLVFGYSLGDSARLSGSWHGAALLGMVGVGILCSGRRRYGSLRGWTIGGCCASALAISSLAAAALVGPGWPLRGSVTLLGVSNGIFAVAAIGSMMELARHGDARNAGVRMGLWGAAQAAAFALGGFFGTSLVDGVRWLAGSAAVAFAVVFVIEAMLFCAAAWLAYRVQATFRRVSATNIPAVMA